MFTLPDLPYDYAALEPYIDETTMRIHHDKHHQTYIDKLNAALKTHPDLADQPIEALIKGLNSLPADVLTAVRNNGGGHFNHSLFWPELTGSGTDQPTGALLDDIESTFGSFDDFKQQFANAAVGVFGSGWAWLVKDGGKLAIVGTPNQDNPLTDGKIPLLGLDVWEHAYYLKYQNKRPDYIAAFWHVVNWDEITKRYNA